MRHCRLFQTKGGKKKQPPQQEVVETPAELQNGKDFIPVALDADRVS